MKSVVSLFPVHGSRQCTPGSTVNSPALTAQMCFLFIFWIWLHCEQLPAWVQFTTTFSRTGFYLMASGYKQGAQQGPHARIFKTCSTGQHMVWSVYKTTFRFKQQKYKIFKPPVASTCSTSRLQSLPCASLGQLQPSHIVASTTAWISSLSQTDKKKLYRAQ